MNSCMTYRYNISTGRYAEEGERLFMHSTQKLKSMQARTDTHCCIYILPRGHNPNIFTLLKLPNDSKALLNTPQQNTAPFISL